jgi:hypothetical protein
LSALDWVEVMSLQTLVESMHRHHGPSTDLDRASDLLQVQRPRWEYDERDIPLCFQDEQDIPLFLQDERDIPLCLQDGRVVLSCDYDSRMRYPPLFV